MNDRSPGVTVKPAPGSATTALAGVVATTAERTVAAATASVAMTLVVRVRRRLAVGERNPFMCACGRITKPHLDSCLVLLSVPTVLRQPWESLGADAHLSWADAARPGLD